MMVTTNKVPIHLAKHHLSTETGEPFNLCPPPDYQQLTVGMRGSGKTTFNRILLEKVIGVRPIAILDSKPDDALLIGDYQIIEHSTDIDKWDYKKHPVLVYRPEADDLIKPSRMDDFLNQLYVMGHVLVYVDELGALQQRYVQRPGLIHLMQRGRERNRNGQKVHSPLWLSSQRPRAIPVQAYTEAMRVVVFDLGSDQDRAEVARDTHSELRMPPKHKHGFRLYDRHYKKPFHFKPLGIKK